MALRKQETSVALLHILFLCILMQIHGPRLVMLALFVGALMALIEFVCIKYFDMWKYNFTNNTIPVWLPFTWAIVALFIIDLFKHCVL